LKRSIQLREIAGVRSRWISRGSWTSDVIGGDDIAQGFPVVGRIQRQTPEPEKVLVAVRLAGNKRNYEKVEIWLVPSVVNLEPKEK
jgi:hypothetical protein